MSASMNGLLAALAAGATLLLANAGYILCFRRLGKREGLLPLTSEEAEALRRDIGSSWVHHLLLPLHVMVVWSLMDNASTRAMVWPIVYLVAYLSISYIIVVRARGTDPTSRTSLIWHATEAAVVLVIGWTSIYLDQRVGAVIGLIATAYFVGVCLFFRPSASPEVLAEMREARLDSEVPPMGEDSRGQ